MVGHEEAHGLVGFGVLVGDLLDAFLVKAKDLRAGQRKDDGGVCGHDELRTVLGELM